MKKIKILTSLLTLPLLGSGLLPLVSCGNKGEQETDVSNFLITYDSSNMTAKLYGCNPSITSIANVNIPGTIKHDGGTYKLIEIGQTAFAAASLTISSVTIPDTVQKIHCTAFAGCSSLAKVTFKDKIYVWNEANSTLNPFFETEEELANKLKQISTSTNNWVKSTEKATVSINANLGTGITAKSFPSSITVDQDFVGTYELSDTKKLNLNQCDILVGGQSIKSRSGVSISDTQVKIPTTCYTTRSISINLVTDDITYNVSVDYNADDFETCNFPTSIVKKSEYKATYTLVNTKVIDYSKCDITINSQSIKSQCTIDDTQIIIPGDLVTSNISIKVVTAEKENYTVSTTGSSSGVTFENLPEKWYIGGNDISATYTIDEATTKKLDETNSDILVGGTSIKSQSGVVYTGGTITIPASLITGNVIVKIVIEDKISYTVSTTGSSSGVTFSGLPEKWYEGGSTISATYSYDTTTMKLDETNSDILVGGTSIKGQSGVYYKNKAITIPASLITDNVIVKIIIENKISYTVSTTGSSSGVTFSGLPEKWYEGGSVISATYSYDTTTMKVDETNSDILVGGTSIKDQSGVEYKNGSIWIPQYLITGNIIVKIIITYQDGYITTSWSDIISACNTFEASDRTAEDISTFLTNFTIPSKTTLTSLDDLVGAWTYITINNQKHIVRIIDTQHDTIATGQTYAGTKAALTFEMVTLLSDANGDKMTSKWNISASGGNQNYTNSILRWNLNGAGSGTKPSSGVWDKSALSMLPAEVSNSIKTVYKNVAITYSYYVDTYMDKLFPLTYTEMAQSDSSYAKVEGTSYKYWTDHNTENDRIKRDVNGASKTYWLVSPYILSGSSRAWGVNDSGGIAGHDITDTYAISFGFCI